MIPITTRNAVRTLSVLFVSAILISFSNTASPTKASAEVSQYQGLYIFTDSKPIAEYNYLGSVNTSDIVWKERGYEDMRAKLLKKLKKEFPDSEGAIISFDNGKGKADAIKFK